MSSIKQDLLMKAQRDTSKLVRVQRQVSRGGKTFTQNFWVQPSQVKTTDTVIGGQQNLLPTPGSVPKPAPGVLDKAYLDSISSDKAKALAYIKSCGLTWKEHTHAGINWMRAMQAVKATLAGQNTVVVSTQATSQQPTKTAKISQNTAQQGAPIQANTLAAMNMLNKKTLDELNACSNGREKVVVLKKNLGLNDCIKFAKLLGVSWSEHPHSGINNMRMSMALQQAFDSMDGTVSPSKAGAPKGNKNAQKDSSDVLQDDSDTQQDATPVPPPSDKLEIPADATERQKNLINLINGIDDSSTLELIQKSGFIPEDAQAQEFIQKKLWTEYDSRIAKRANSGSNNYLYYRNSGSFSADVSEFSSKIFKGLTKKVIKRAVNNTSLASDTFMISIVNPGAGIQITPEISADGGYSSRYSDEGKVYGVLEDLSQFSRYDNDLYTSKGYDGKDLSEYTKQYDKSKEGFVRVLEHIGKNQPELKSEADKMAKEYDELMKLCGGSPKLLKYLLTTSYVEVQERQKNFSNEEEALGIIKNYLKSQGITDTEIDATLSEEWSATTKNGAWGIRVRESRNDSYGVYKQDASGRDVFIDMSSLKLSDGTDVKSVVASYGSFHRRLSEIYEGKSNLYTGSNISETGYNEIFDRTCKLFGTKLVDKTDGSDPKYPASQRTWAENKELIYQPDLNDERSAILANLMYIQQGVRLRAGIQRNRDECPNSSANKNGTDYSGNYDCYSPDFGVTNFGSGPYSVFSSKADELKAIDSQLEKVRTFSLDYHKKLKEYAEHEGDPTFKSSYYGDNYRSSLTAKIASVSIGAKPITENTFSQSNPATDLLLSELIDAAIYAPQNFGTRTSTIEKLDSSVRKKLNHQQYSFKSYTTQTNAPSSSNLKQLREKALTSAHCSLAFVDDSKRQEVEHEIKINFDRVDANGKRVPKSQRVYDNRTLVFHSGVYEIKNSQAGEDFDKESQRMGEAPRHTYHGTSYSGACGIVGVDGRFRFKRTDTLPGQSYTGTMLGEGIYVAKMVGKNCPYIGNDKYSYTHYTASDKDTKGSADGVLIVCDTVFGKYGEFQSSSEAQRNNKNEGGTYDSVAVGAGALMPGGGTLKEYECIVTRQNMVAPRYLVDCGARRR